MNDTPLNTIELTVEADVHDRLDTYLAETLEDVSRSKIKTWIKDGRVTLDGVVRKGSFMVGEGMNILIDPPQERRVDDIVPEDIPLNIVHEDEAIILIDKQPGLVVHPGAGVYSGTLVNALAFHFGKLSQRGGAERPGIVHRLDRGTSGLILVAKTDQAHAHLTEQWQRGAVTKVYQALAWGVPDPGEGEVQTHIGRHTRYRQMMAAEVEGGRFAHSRYKVVEAYDEASKVNVHILTGRTHQIRVHLAHIGHPVVGDALYGRNRHKNLAKSFEAMPERPMLHAAVLQFEHPLTGETMSFKQPPPADFHAIAAELSRWPY